MYKHLSNSTHFTDFMKYRNEIPYRSSSILISIAMTMTLSNAVLFSNESAGVFVNHDDTSALVGKRLFGCVPLSGFFRLLNP